MTRTILVTLLCAFLCSPLWGGHPLKFEVKLLTVDANEGCDVADVDGDGKLDVVAGRNWYRHGEWVPRPVRLIDDWSGYVRSNGDWAYDVNGDGRPDVVTMDFTQGNVCWYENPGAEALARGMLWPQHVLVDTKQQTNEVCYLVDINGDGTPEWIANQWNPKSDMILWQFGTEEKEVDVQQGGKTEKVRQSVPVLVGHVIGSQNGHGIGFGDINNDQREDILIGTGWYERPEGDPLAQTWKFHPDWELQAACPMLVTDLDGDGVNDIVGSEAHKYGIYIRRGLGPAADGKLQFEEHLIDKSFSQAHCLVFADLDGDGVNELITGKRVRAHNGGDPGSGDPPIMRYYVWNPQSKSYEGHTINEGAVGGGLQIRTADLDADGDIDIVVAGKDGTQILFNQRL